MLGEILQVPLTKKQQQSQTVHNFIQYLTEFYDDFKFEPYCLATYYPKYVQKQIQRKRNQNTDRIVQGIKAPTQYVPGSNKHHSSSSSGMGLRNAKSRKA